MKNKAFTLIEIIIVILIIGILITLSVPMLEKAKYRSEASEAFKVISAIKQAEELYYAEYGCYYILCPSPDSSRWAALGLEDYSSTGNFVYAMYGPIPPGSPVPTASDYYLLSATRHGYKFRITYWHHDPSGVHEDGEIEWNFDLDVPSHMLMG
jgi:prepilin-type N-terminal cleavage/methylation domain-containing protein